MDRSISGTIALPYLGMNDFDKIILLKNLDLDPATVSHSTVEILTGSESRRFVDEHLKMDNTMPPPVVRFIPRQDRLEVEIEDSRKGTYMRCLHMGVYVGCYPIPRKYKINYNKIKHIEKVDIIFLSQEGMESNPASFVF